MFGVTIEDVNYVVKCPCCKKLTGFIEEREDGFIECMHCDYDIEVLKNLVSNGKVIGGKAVL